MINNNKKGFTLIELLVVVASGILAAVGVVAYNDYTNSVKNACINNHNQLKKYYNKL